MKYHFEFSPHSERDFSHLEKKIQHRILKKLSIFEKTDQPLLFAKKLTGAENIYRFRVGDYRILVSPMDKKTFIILLVLKIGHRRDIYDF